jgi:hypothetical protein
MNNMLNALIAALLAGTCAQALAASTVDLAVIGVITPNACTPSLSGSGIVDYGKLSAKDLNLTTATPLPLTTLQMMITCDGATLFAIKSTDNRAGSSSNLTDRTYGMGLINSTQKLGFYAVSLENAVADTVAATVLESLDNGTTWREALTGMPPTSLVSFGDRSSGSWLPIPIARVTTDMHIWGYIARADSLDLSDEHPIDGSATFEVKYL